MKPSTIFTELSHPPDFGIACKNDGNIAKRANGRASPRAKPPMPTAGPMIAPCEAASTRRVPIIGPVQEKDTSTRVKAMKNMLTRPEVVSALLSMALAQRDGSFISNAPKNDIANTTRSRKKIILNTAEVAISFSLPAPKHNVMPMPRIRKITTMLSPYITALVMAFDRCLDVFRKKAHRHRYHRPHAGCEQGEQSA